MSKHDLIAVSHIERVEQQSLPTEFPELLPDIKFPEYLNKKLFVNPTIWIGSGGNTSPLHYDGMDNLFSQVSDGKRFLLFDPQQTSLLYPFPADSKIPHMSQINIEEPDLEKFPNFQKAKYFECIVELGEILFIPAFWWHQVYSLRQFKSRAKYFCKFLVEATY